MNKEEILRRAREENKGVDEVKRSVENDAARISAAIGAAVCMLLNLLDRLILHSDVVGDTCWIIYGSMIASRVWVEGIALKKNGYVIGAICTTAFVILLAVFLFVGK